MTNVALIGRPVAESLSPRMQNAAFAALGLDWTYIAVDVGDPVGAVRALVDLGFAGANVTIPFNTDREIVAGIGAERACLIGAGGAAEALRPALPADTRVYSRSGTWPPDASGCDLIVNATPVRDELLVTPESGQVVVDLAYGPRETALVAAARSAGCEIVDGREALVRQGAASFRIWTGLDAPVDAMRAAVRP